MQKLLKCLPPVGESLCAAHGVWDDGGVLDGGVGELLPRWRQQDLLGTAGPGLLQRENPGQTNHLKVTTRRQKTENWPDNIQSAEKVLLLLKNSMYFAGI